MELRNNPMFSMNENEFSLFFLLTFVMAYNFTVISLYINFPLSHSGKSSCFYY